MRHTVEMSFYFKPSSTIFIENDNIKHYRIITIQLPLRHIFLDVKSLERFSGQKPDLIAYNEYVYLIFAALILNVGQMSLSFLPGTTDYQLNISTRDERTNLDGNC